MEQRHKLSGDNDVISSYAYDKSSNSKETPMGKRKVLQVAGACGLRYAFSNRYGIATETVFLDPSQNIVALEHSLWNDKSTRLSISFDRKQAALYVSPQEGDNVGLLRGRPLRCSRATPVMVAQYRRLMERRQC